MSPSIRPSDFVEGGAVPVDRNLLWKECRFNLFDYTKKSGEVVATTVAARITYMDDDGTEHIQQYSVTDPNRFQPSKDGKTLIAVGDSDVLSKSSNFFLLMNALINAGFPENKLDEDISKLDGLYTYNIGVPEPKRSGLMRATPVEGAREKVLSVPSQILRLPWEKKAGAKGAAKGKAVAPVEEDEDVAADALALLATLLEDAESVTRQQLAAQAIRDKKNAVARFVFQAEFQAAIMADGYSLDGEVITTE